MEGGSKSLKIVTIFTHKGLIVKSENYFFDLDKRLSILEIGHIVDEKSIIHSQLKLDIN